MAKDKNTNHYLGCNFQHFSGNVDCQVIKVDALDSVLWKRKYGLTDPWWEFPTSIVCSESGNILVGCIKYDLNLPNMKSYTWLFEIDSSGNMVRQWFDSDSTMEAKGLKQTQDGGFVFASKKIQSQDIGDAFCHSTIVKLDSSFLKEWAWESQILTSSFIGLEDVEELQSGGYVAAGNGNYVNPQYNLLSAFIIKLDENGNVVWSNGYTAIDTSGAENFLNDIDVLPDGSYVAVGYVNLPSSVQQTQRQQAWILKVDSNGCIIENCVVGVEEPQPELKINGELKIYPNPAQNSIYVEYDGIADGSKLIIVNTVGVVLETKILSDTKGKFTVNTSQYLSGIYLARVDTDNDVVLKNKFIILK